MVYRISVNEGDNAGPGFVPNPKSILITGSPKLPLHVCAAALKVSISTIHRMNSLNMIGRIRALTIGKQLSSKNNRLLV